MGANTALRRIAARWRFCLKPKSTVGRLAVSVGVGRLDLKCIFTDVASWVPLRGNHA
jgi:hypothetical protein